MRDYSEEIRRITGINPRKCMRCGKCSAVCRMCADPKTDPNSAECIRCGDCVRVCPTGAISCGFKTKK